ncbi:MAG TPA: immunoglobulin domain-containing protein [Verrucomicrobiae bacterium]
MNRFTGVWLGLLLMLGVVQNSAGAEYSAANLLPSQLAGKTLWLQIVSKGGNAAYESTGSYKAVLHANGTYSVPAASGISPRSGTWSAFKNYDVLYLDLTGWFNDSTVDVFVFFSVSGVSVPAYYEIHREHLDPEEDGGNQVGIVRITDGEAPSPMAPVISSISGGGTRIINTDIVLSVTALSDLPMTYQWSRNNTPIDGATQSTYPLNNIQPANSGTYSVVVGNGVGNASTNTVLTVGAGESPTFLVQPSNNYWALTQTPVITCTVTGTPPIGWFWQKDGVPLVNGPKYATLAAGTSPTAPASPALYITDFQAVDAGGYSVVVTNNFGSITSVVAQIQVSTLPVIAENLKDQYVITNSPFSLSLVASGTPVTAVLWYKNGSYLTSTETPLLQRISNPSAVADTYYAVLQNGAGSVTSAVVKVQSFLTTAPDVFFEYPNEIRTIGTTISTTQNTRLTIAASAYGVPPLAFYWYRNDSLIPSHTAVNYDYPTNGNGFVKILDIPSVQGSDAGTYYVVASNQFGSRTSKVVTVSVQLADVPYIAIQPLGVRTYTTRLTSAGSVSIGFTSSVSATLYWYTNNTLHTARTTTYGAGSNYFSYSLTRTFANTNAIYAVVSNQFGMSTSAVVTAEVYLSPGTPEADFSLSGRTFGNSITKVISLPDGSVLVGGAFSIFNSITTGPLLQFQRDGNPTNFRLTNSLNTGYISGGVSNFYRFPDGKLLVVGSLLANAFPALSYANIIRFNTDGTIDTTFTGGRYTDASTSAYDQYISCAATNADQAVYIGGRFSTVQGNAQKGFARLSSSGAFDSGFRPTIANTNGTMDIYAVLVQADGKVLIGGTFTNINGTAITNLARLNDTGTLDTSFTPAYINGAVRSLALVNGYIVIGGDFGNVGNSSPIKPIVARLSANGILDTSWGLTNITAGGMVREVVPMSDGRVIAVGNFTTTVASGNQRKQLLRISLDGTADQIFAGGKDWDPNQIVNSAALTTDGHLWIGGNFTAIGNITINRLALLSLDAPLVTLIAPVLGMPVLVSGNVSFTLATTAGIHYELQSTTSLSSPTWITGESFNGDGNIHTFAVSNTGAQKFYRVMATLVP